MDRMQTSKLGFGRRLGSRRRQLGTAEMNMGMDKGGGVTV